jgi:hypothetical protein
MPEPPPSRDWSRYAALGQVGMEMVAPIALGALLDNYLGWTPGLTVAGALLGFVGGMMHLLALLNKPQDKEPPQPGQESR